MRVMAHETAGLSLWQMTATGGNASMFKQIFSNLSACNYRSTGWLKKEAVPLA
jgi:hypothetical protein